MVYVFENTKIKQLARVHTYPNTRVQGQPRRKKQANIPQKRSSVRIWVQGSRKRTGRVRKPVLGRMAILSSSVQGERTTVRWLSLFSKGWSGILDQGADQGMPSSD